ncbi:unnamed protein product [Amoebophrya sp. A25]|nr:unnamed protein product [Amoebophrya sp. A25]|eukprot:GSA25T00000355001.1
MVKAMKSKKKSKQAALAKKDTAQSTSSPVTEASDLLKQLRGALAKFRQDASAIGVATLSTTKDSQPEAAIISATSANKTTALVGTSTSSTTSSNGVSQLHISEIQAALEFVGLSLECSVRHLKGQNPSQDAELVGRLESVKGVFAKLQAEGALSKDT